MTSRHFGIDVLKVVCAQLIVWHHAMVYAPMNVDFTSHWPTLSAFLLEPGRWVVHVFLVIGGYLSAAGLERSNTKLWTPLVWRRYGRLMPMFVLALGLTALVGEWMRLDLVPGMASATPGWQVWLAHLTLSFDWMSVPAISAGAWYVAIDFQLYVLLALWVVHTRRARDGVSSWVKPAVVTAATVLSVTVISKFPQLDIAAPYFISAYGLGCLVAWHQHRVISSRWLWLVVGAILFDLLLEWRGRQAFALLTALLLLAWPLLQRKPTSPDWLARASDLSYPLFVGHFSLLMLLGSWWTQHGMANTAASPWVYLVLLAGLGWGWAMLLEATLERLVAGWTRHFLARTRWA